MEDCIFCKILTKQLPADVIYEDDMIMAFMNIRPVSKGHIVLIPKRHAKDLTETSDEDLSAMILQTKKIGMGVMKATGAQGFNLGVNTGTASGQEVFHTHFHIIPRYINDGLRMWPHSESEPKTRTEIADEIKKHLV